jgi:SAM-dependent methyltransferase
MHQTDRPFDRRLRRLRRDRAAATGRDDPIRRHAADELIERLGLVQRPFTRALDLGCGPGRLAERLARSGLDVVAADAGGAFATLANGVQCDEDRLPFEASFDLIVSAGGLDSVNDLPGALILIRRALKPGGLFLAAFPGAGSLPLLRQAMRAADAARGLAPSPHIHPQIDVRAAGDLMVRAGFAMPVADCENLTLRYAGLAGLVADLRAAAATNLLTERSRRYLGRAGWAAAQAEFARHADADGRIGETIVLNHVSGWRPEAS